MKNVSFFCSLASLKLVILCFGGIFIISFVRRQDEAGKGLERYRAGMGSIPLMIPFAKDKNFCTVLVIYLMDVVCLILNINGKEFNFEGLCNLSSIHMTSGKEAVILSTALEDRHIPTSFNTSSVNIK